MNRTILVLIAAIVLSYGALAYRVFLYDGERQQRDNAAIGQCLQMGGTARLNWDGERMKLAACEISGIRQ